MADFADSCVRSDMDEIKTRLPIWSENPADVASPYALSSSVSEAAKKDGEELKKLHQSHGEVLENNSCGNRSSKNACTEQEASRPLTCNRMTALQGVENDADCVRSSDSKCGMHEDLLFDIMLWLPVASLLRFRSVCRLWCSLIDSSSFITQHYNHSSNKSCLLGHHMVSTYDYKFCLLSGNKYEVYSNLDYEQSWCSAYETSILNSCNGIVSLLNAKSGNIALWNPATKKLRPLPESSIFHQYICKGMNFEYGFGFVAKSNDYKFVRILHHCENKHKNVVEVYSLRTDSWKIIHKDSLLPFQCIDCDDSVFKKGTCFWIGYTHHDEFSPILVSFDLNNEVFETMPMPGERNPNRVSRPYNTALDLLNDKMCYIKGMRLAPPDTYHKYYEIWMLGEYDVKEPWEKICKFGPASTSERGPLQVLGLSKNGEFLLLGYRCRNGELYLSKFDAGEAEEHLGLRNPQPLPSKFVCFNKLQNPNPFLDSFVFYNESLVSLKREDFGTYK